MFFVPWNANEPIFRIPFAKTKTIERVERKKTDNDRAEGKNQFLIEATMRVDMKYGNRNVPYIKSTGEFSFLFSLIYTSLTTVIPRLKELFRIFKLPEEQCTLEIGKIIADHEQSESFNPGWLESEDEVIQYQVFEHRLGNPSEKEPLYWTATCCFIVPSRAQTTANRIMPLIRYPGRIVLTNERIYFQPYNVVSTAPIVSFQLKSIVALMKRRYNLEEVGLEIFFDGWTSTYFAVKNQNERLHC